MHKHFSYNNIYHVKTIRHKGKTTLSIFTIVFISRHFSTIPESMFVLAELNLRVRKTNHYIEEGNKPQTFIDDKRFLDSFQNMLLQQDLQVLNNELVPVTMYSHTNSIDGGYPQSNKGNNHGGYGSAHTMFKESAIYKNIVNGFDIKMKSSAFA